MIQTIGCLCKNSMERHNFSKMSSGGSSYEATEAGPHLSFWENAIFFPPKTKANSCLLIHMSVIIRGECLRSLNPTGVVKTMIFGHWSGPQVL